MSNNKQRQLLLLASILAVLQFWVVPALQQQTQQRVQLEQLSNQLARLQGTVNNAPKLHHASAQLPEFYTILTQRFATITEEQPANQVRLNMQQLLQQELTAFGLEVVLFEWLGNTVMVEEGLEQHQLRLVLNGQPPQLMQAYQKVFNSESSFFVQQVEYRQVNTGRRNTNIQGNLTLLLQTLILLPDVRPAATILTQEVE